MDRPDTATANKIVCTACGHVSETTDWKPGDTCPSCKSSNYFPAYIRKVVAKYLDDYKVRGLPKGDVRFGQVALWGGLIGKKQLKEALLIQQERLDRGQKVQIGQIFIEKKAMTPKQVDAVLAVQHINDPADSDRFGQIALVNEFVTQQQLDECLAIQSLLKLEYSQTPFLGQILIERGHLKDDRVQRILTLQKGKLEGIAYKIEKEIEKRSPLQRALQDKWTRGMIAVLVGLVLFAFVILPLIKGRGLERECLSCKRTFSSNVLDGMVKCPHCGNAASGFKQKIYCGKCGARSEVVRKSLTDTNPIICPKCNDGSQIKPG